MQGVLSTLKKPCGLLPVDNLKEGLIFGEKPVLCHEDVTLAA